MLLWRGQKLNIIIHFPPELPYDLELKAKKRMGKDGLKYYVYYIVCCITFLQKRLYPCTLH